MKITWINRRKSYEKAIKNKKLRYVQILERLCLGNKSAKEIAVELYNLNFVNTDERNVAAPSLTELEKMGFVEETAKKICEYTGRTVTVYKITKEGFNFVNEIK